MLWRWWSHTRRCVGDAIPHGRRDSNPRMPVLETGALAAWRRPLALFCCPHTRRKRKEEPTVPDAGVRWVPRRFGTTRVVT